MPIKLTAELTDDEVLTLCMLAKAPPPKQDCPECGSTVVFEYDVRDPKREGELLKKLLAAIAIT